MIFKRFRKLSPARIIAFGFACLILIGSLLLYLPCSLRDGVQIRYIDALYTSASAVCVTGLIAVDAGDTFSSLGQFFLALLIQAGGLGLTALGAGVILAVRKKINLKASTLVKESMNLHSGKGIAAFVKNIFLTTLCFEIFGAIFSFIVFVKDYPIKRAVGLALFHSVAAFNNSGFDIFGNYQSMVPYRDNILLNLITCALIFFGGIGFLVICDLAKNRFRWHKLSMHSKVVLSMSGVLTVVGTLLLKFSEDISWLSAFFHSVSARTAGFSSHPIGSFTDAGLLVLLVLMFVGASPGSTGGGIKTSTLFVLIQGIKFAATGHSEKAFHYAIPKDAFKKAATIVLIALLTILVSSYLILCFDPAVDFRDAVFEMTSAFGTVGLSTGITPTLSVMSKLISVFMMYIGRLGPMTVASLWYFTHGENVKFPDGNIAIG